MKKMMLAAAALSFTFAAHAHGKLSKEERKTLMAECKQENPSAKKSDIKKCVKEKAKAKEESSETK